MKGAHFFCEIRAGARIFRGSKYSVTPGRIANPLSNPHEFKKFWSQSALILISDKPRVGLKAFSGAAFGFIFVDLSCPVSFLRDEIQTQVK